MITCMTVDNDALTRGDFMKTLKFLAGSFLVAVASLMTSQAFAVDFNSIIVENNKAQKELHAQVKESVKDVKIAALEQRNKYQVVAVNDSTAINVKTEKDFLTFAKEKKQSKPSRLQNDKRLAQELKDLE